MIQVVIFDADGLLFNQERFSTYLERIYNIPHEKMLPFFTGPFQDCITGKFGLQEAVTPFLTDWGWNDGVDAFLELWFSRELNVDHRLFEYVQALRKQGILCFVATNQEKIRFQYMLDKMNLTQSFDGVYASAHLGYKKPDQQFFEKVLENIPNIPKNEILFWDDRPTNIEAGKIFGVNAELYTTFENLREKMKEYNL
jgi:putative hydrolase of the HAD superfamily